MLNGLHVLQIETKRPTRPQTTTKVPVPIVVVGRPAYKKAPAGRVLDGGFAV